MKILHLGFAAAMIGVAIPTDTLPPNTVQLSEMMRELSAKPGFTEAFLKQLEGGKKSTALLTPDLIDHLRTLIVGKDWSGLDRFPGWTMSEVTPTVGALSRIAGDKGSRQLAKYLDLGPNSLDAGGMMVDFREPAPQAPMTQPTTLGDGITRGDGPSLLAGNHAESQRLADTLNRLAANSLDGVPFANVFWNDERTPSTPEELIDDLMATGQTVTVTDSRYFANFGHLHWNGPHGDRDVMMPFFVDTQLLVPGTNRPLLVPVSHAEYEWHIRGPLLNADVSFYFGIDGKAQFRTMDELDQAWVMKRDAHTYTGADAVEVTRLAAQVVRAYARLHQAHPAMPFGGYYAFGVCQDVVAAIELKMTGSATLFPNTADDRFFAARQADPSDAEIDALILRLPKDRAGQPPDPARVFASLPTGQSDAELATISIPGLGADLIAVHRAWRAGTLEHTESLWHRRMRLAALTLAAAIALGLAWHWLRKKT